MVDDFTTITPENNAPPPPPAANRLTVGKAILVILLTTLPLISTLYLGAALLNLPFVPFDLVDWPVRAGFAPWASLVDSLNDSATMGAPLVHWVLAVGLFLLAALLFGLAFYAFMMRRGRAPDLLDGVTIGVLFGVPLLFISLITSPSLLPGPFKFIWLAALFVTWGVVLSYAFGRMMKPRESAVAGEESGIGRRQFLLQFGAGAAAVTAIGAAGGKLVSSNQKSVTLQKTLPMLGPEFIAAQNELFGNFRRFAIVRGGGESAADSNVVALGAEYPDRNYVSVWLGGRSPIVIYESLASAVAAFSTEEDESGVYWLDD